MFLAPRVPLIAVCFSLLLFTCCGSGETTVITKTGAARGHFTSPCDSDCKVNPRINNVWTARDASCECINAAIQRADAGDTIIVPPGIETWSNYLLINKGIILKGAGIGQTVIKSNISNYEAAIIVYKPFSPAANQAFRLTGFTLDCNNSSNGIKLSNPSTTIINNIRIDSNRISNPGGKNAGRAIVINGTVYGVIDNNIIEKGGNKAIDSYGLQATSWKNLSRTFGSPNNIYYEDNVFTGAGCFHSAGHGGRYVSRYNSYSGATRNVFPVFDMHGNQPKVYGAMVGEIYGNAINMGPFGGNLVDQRGGQAVIFGNHVSQTVGANMIIKVREEYNDNLFGDRFVQHVTNSYYWNNRKFNNELIIGRIPSRGQSDATCPQGSLYNQHSGYCLTENVDFFNQNENYNGSTERGIYCGPSLPENCTYGDGAWITTQSCASINAASVGANPRIPISGSLYKCNANRQWESYYTPYPYPHPLRSIFK